MIEKVKSFITDVKTHWNKPAEGRYVPYKEYKDIFLAIVGNTSSSLALSYIAFNTGCYLMMYHYKLPYLAYSIIGIINMPLNYIWTLFWWYVCDNLGRLPKKNERLIYLVYSSLVVVGLWMILGDFSLWFNQASGFIIYLNNLEGMTASSVFKILGTHILFNGWCGLRNLFWRKKLIPKFGRYKYPIYTDVIPKCIMVILIGWLPIYNIPAVETRVWVANLLFSIFNVFGFGGCIENCANNISPNPHERLLVKTYPVKLGKLPESLLTIIIPALIGMLKYKWEDINIFRYIIPAVFIVSSAFTVLFAGRVKERIPQPPIDKKVQIKFWDGLFGVLHNKYHWINTIVGLIDSLGNGMLGFTTVLYLYTFRLSGLLYALIVNLIVFAGTPPDFLTPFIAKRFSFKQIMIFHQLSLAIGNALVVCAIIFCGDRTVLCGTICCAVLFFLEMTKTVPYSVKGEMGVRINDYQMYISGERLESYSGVFGWFTGPITSFVGLIIPLLLLKYGFNSNWDVLYIDESRIKIIAVPLIIDIVGYVLMTIPYIFWNYDTAMHKKVINVLERRATLLNEESENEKEPETVIEAEVK